MVDQVALTKLCGKIIGGVIMLFSLMYIPGKQYGFMIFLILLGFAMLLPPLLAAKESNAKFLSRYLLVGANITVLVTQCISGHYEPSVPLFICLGALSALFYEPRLVQFSFITSGVFFIMEFTILSIRGGGLISEVIVLVELLVALGLSCALIVATVKSGCRYYEQATAREEETKKLLAELDQKNAQTEQVLSSQEGLLGEIGRVADRVEQETETISSQSQMLASGAAAQAGSMEELGAAVQEVCTQIGETADYAKRIREDSETMADHVGAGGARMEELLRAIREIEEQMRAVEKIIKSIDDIAFQTNILALNAAVESARAGAAGKGFAVVADEVRRLAGSSAEATSNTIEVLNGCRDAVRRGVSTANETAEALEKIRSSVYAVKDQAFRISDMSAAQLAHFDDMNTELAHVSDVVQSNASAAEESAGAVQELMMQVQQLHALRAAK